jgi:AcrR family transcriptional regulator
VARAADTSVSLIYSYFRDRDDLIAVVLVERYRRDIMELMEIICAPFEGVTTKTQFNDALMELVRRASDPDTVVGRRRRDESMSFAGHNLTAERGIDQVRAEIAGEFVTRVKHLEDLGLLRHDLSARAFIRLWFRLVAVGTGGSHELAVSDEEWQEVLHLVARSCRAE